MIDFSKLAVCGKRTFSNGEKKKFSGYMNHWTPLAPDPNYPVRHVSHFLFKQKIHYYFDQIPNKIIHTLSKRQKVKWCLDNGYWSEGQIYSYRQIILVIELSVQPNYDPSIRVLSGDNDILNFSGFTADYKTIQSFIQSNFKEREFYKMFTDFWESNNAKQK